jgi:hypothetical protein
LEHQDYQNSEDRCELGELGTPSGTFDHFCLGWTAVNHYSRFGEKMSLKAPNQLLGSLNINPDEIEDEKYARLFAFYLQSLKNRTNRLNSLKQKTKSFEMRSIYLKVNKPNLKLVFLKRVKIFLLKRRYEKESFYRTRNLNQN